MNLSGVLSMAPFGQSFAVERAAAPQFVEGRMVEGPVQMLPMTGAIQPAAEGEVAELRPEGTRGGAMIRVHTAAELMEGDEDRVADVVLWQGGRYRVVRVQRWHHLGGFFRSIAEAE